jgi:hypothetical protein
MTVPELLAEVSRHAEEAKAASRTLGDMNGRLAQLFRSARMALAEAVLVQKFGERWKEMQAQEPLQATCGCGLLTVQRVGTMEMDGVVHRYGKPCEPKK